MEDSGGASFRAHFGECTVPGLLSPAPPGAERDAEPGFVLVAESSSDPAPVVAFAHVVLLPGPWGVHPHLEQVSVRLPEHGRRGIGTLLVLAAMEETRWSGHDTLTLCTYRDVPWNAPFYAALGFREVSDPPAYLRRMRERERSLGLDLPGPRIVMRTSLRHGLDRSGRDLVTDQ